MMGSNNFGQLGV